MQLFKATNDFKLNGVSYEGFPLIVDSEMKRIKAITDFLIHYCLHRGRVTSKASWWKYGTDLYDYFSFLEYKSLDWKSSLANQQQSVVASYRDWSVNEGISNTTINGRLRTIIQFYEYALRKKWIDIVPYDIELILVNRSQGFLTHTDRSGKLKPSVDVMLKTQKKQLQILTKNEIKRLVTADIYKSQHLIYRMALQTGLRREELFTFPESYIKSPGQYKGQRYIAVIIKSEEMDVKEGIGGTKGNKERTIHIPYSLYKDLYFYKIYDRHAVLLNNGIKYQKSLFINKYGKPYSTRSQVLNTALKAVVGRKDVSLHMLRHTFATYKLYELSKNPEYTGNALVYIQNRLGHSSITTTEKYLHYLEDLEGEVMSQYDEDIDHLTLRDEVIA